MYGQHVICVCQFLREENGSMCPSCREEGVAEDDDCAEPTKVQFTYQI